MGLLDDLLGGFFGKDGGSSFVDPSGQKDIGRTINALALLGPEFLALAPRLINPTLSANPRKREKQLARINRRFGLDELAEISESISGGFRDLLGEEETGLLDQFKSLTSGFLDDTLSGLSQGTGSVQGLIDQALGGLDTGKEFINQTFEDTLRQGSADISRSLSRRGLGGSTGLESEIVENLLPNALSGKLGALSNLEGQRAQTALGGAGILSNRLNTTDQLAQQARGGVLQGQLGIGQQFSGLRLNEFDRGRQQLTGNLLGGQGGFFPQLQSQQNPQSLTNAIGGTLGGLFGFDLGGGFGGGAGGGIGSLLKALGIG